MIQIDGVGINAKHFEGKKEADFIAEMLPGLPDKFGNEHKKIVWLKKAFNILNPVKKAKS